MAEDVVDDAPRNFVSNPQDSKYSYTTLVLVDGAPVELLAGAHYRKNRDPSNTSNFSLTEHTADMQAFDGVPIFVEEDPTNYLVNVDDSAWGNDDCIVARHMASGNIPGYGNLSYHDTHVGRVALLPKVAAKGRPYFSTNSMCIRTTGRKWISGQAWGEVSYGYVSRARPASDFGVHH